MAVELLTLLSYKYERGRWRGVGWTWFIKSMLKPELDAVKINPITREPKRIDFRKLGFEPSPMVLYGITVVVDNPYITCNVYIETELVFSGNPYFAKQIGAPVQKYDEVNNVYSFVVTPPRPIVAAGNVEMEVYIPEYVYDIEKKQVVKVPEDKLVGNVLYIGCLIRRFYDIEATVKEVVRKFTKAEVPRRIAYQVSKELVREMFE